MADENEQLDLIDVGPVNAKVIAPIARKYKKAVQARLAAGKIEADLKEQLRALVAEAKLKPLDDGVIRFKCDGLTISATPRDLLIQVKEDSEAE